MSCINCDCIFFRSKEHSPKIYTQTPLKVRFSGMVCFHWVKKIMTRHCGHCGTWFPFIMVCALSSWCLHLTHGLEFNYIYDSSVSLYRLV